ncbi:patched domain-containing protein 3 [Hyalella azteca]|uniref:Patched domain-containing protein 3 n=1 Tax=Hyalella azteca TaxID=294128 RepID=A0A979FI79_HYAAZ|nr:patched domain-containing protein 3 [Hyalella azteca]
MGGTSERRSPNTLPAPAAHQRRCRHPTPPRDPNTMRGSGRPEITHENMSIIGKLLTRFLPNSKFVENKKNFFFERFDSLLSRLFFKLGEAIADHTGYFIMVPLFITIIFATAYQRISWTDDPEYLFSPSNGRARQERAVLDKYFPTNTSKMFDAARLIRNGRYVHFGVMAKDETNLIDEELWSELKAIDHYALNFEFQDEAGNTYTYEDVCARIAGKCVGNNFLELGVHIPEMKQGKFKFPFPVMLNPSSFANYVFPSFMAGIELHPDNTIKIARAVKLHYWGTSSTKEMDQLSNLWEKAFLKKYLAGELNAIAPNLEISIHNSRTAELEFQENTRSVLPYFLGTFFVMVTFCLATVSMGDCVRSKTLLGLAGIISAALATSTAFGVLIYYGVTFIGINLAAPFLMLGIGIDDTFVMLAAWQRARFQDTVRERLSSAYADAAVSITITSLTNMISFYVGTLTPFASVQIFCMYTGLSVFLTYIWHITLFGACLALCGKMEKKQMHNITCRKVKPVSESKEEPYLYRACCSGGVSVDDPYNPEDNQPHAIMIIFRDYVAEFINMPVVKGLIMACFVIYFGFAIYGCTIIQEGMETRKLARYDSYTVPFYNFVEKYFSTFAYRPMIVFTGNITYSDPATEKLILDFVERVESHESIGDPLYTECWLRQWKRYMEKNGQYLGLNNSDEKTYIHNLQELVLFMLMFILQLTLVRSTSLTAISLAAIVMMVISFIFIPNPVCSLWVGFSIVSIETGVIGYMSHWGVNLDPISMIQLIMCIGFSVDFTAHICYAYLSARVDTPEERVRECLYSLGLPVMQGALSTLLGVLTLVMVPSYIFITFFKTVFLVIFLGALHGLFLIPVFLSLFGPGSCSKRVKNTDESTESYDMAKVTTNGNNQNGVAHRRSTKLNEPQIPPHLQFDDEKQIYPQNSASTQRSSTNDNGRKRDTPKNANGRITSPNTLEEINLGASNNPSYNNDEQEEQSDGWDSHRRSKNQLPTSSRM